jgi:hypothetical protein
MNPAVRRGIAALAAPLVLAGCVSAPVQEIRHFKDALAAVNTVQQPFLDELAIAERAQGVRDAESRAGRLPSDTVTPCPGEPSVTPRWRGTAEVGIANHLCLSDAVYFVSDTDPPATASFRRSLRIVDEFANLILALAEGQGAGDAAAGALALAKEVDSLAALAKSGLPAVAPPLAALAPALELIAQAQSKQESLQRILDNAKPVGDLIGALRNATHAQFNTAVFVDLNIVGSSPDPAATEAVKREHQVRREQALQRVTRTRAQLAASVVLLDKLKAAWEVTVTAARNPRTSLADVAARAAELRAVAEAVRKNLAELRTR